jgi:hypothetical protein
MMADFKPFSHTLIPVWRQELQSPANWTPANPQVSYVCPESVVAVPLFLKARLQILICVQGIIFDRFNSHMAKDGFTEVQQKLEAIALELKNENDPDRGRTILKEMSQLLAEAQRISRQPPKIES